MAAVLHLLDQRRLIDSNGISDGGSIAFYLTGTTTLATIYSDIGLTTPLTNPVVVGAGAEVPPIYLDGAVTYRRIITYSDGSTDETDPYTQSDYLAAAAASATAAATSATNAAIAETAAELAQTTTESARDEVLAYGNTAPYVTWAALAAATGMAAGDLALVLASDTGTHTDPVVGGTVNNAGVFRYDDSPAGWERVGDLESQLASGFADDAAASAADAALTIKQVTTQTDPWSVANEDGLTIAAVDADGGFSTKGVALTATGATHENWASSYSDSDLVSAVTFADADRLVIASFDPSGSQVPGIAAEADVPTTGDIAEVANRPNSIIGIGDSIVEQNSIARTLYDMERKADYGPLVWADFFLGGRLVHLHNAGVGGETTAAVRTRHSAEVVAYAPGFNLVHCGINSITSTSPVYSVASITADLQAMYEANAAAGIVTVALTVLPLYTGHASVSNATFAKICEVNEWIRAYARANRGILLADVFAKVINPTASTGVARQYYLQTDDNIHPSPLGARVMGQCIADAVSDHIKPLDFLPTSIADKWGLTSSGKQLLDNPLFQGTGGTNTAGTTFTGTVPDGWRIGKSGTWGVGMVSGSVAANADGFGNDWIITVTNAGAAGDTLTLIYDDTNNARVTNGDVLRMACQFNASGLAKFMGFKAQASTTGGSTTNIGSTMEYTAQQPTTGSPQNWTADLYPQTDFSGVLVSGKATVPAGTITQTRPSIVLRFDGSGAAGVFRIGRFGMWKD